MNELIGRTNRSVDGCDLLDGWIVCVGMLVFPFGKLLSSRQREKNQRLILGVTSYGRFLPVTANRWIFQIEIINLTL